MEMFLDGLSALAAGAAAAGVLLLALRRDTKEKRGEGALCRGDSGRGRPVSGIHTEK